MSESGLDYDFLQYIGHDAEAQKKHQRFYVQFFEGCQRVVDLGCGNGEFVELLTERGINAIGVDSDPIAVQHLRERGVPVVQQDVLSYLDELPAESINGIFAAHLVEHLPYDKVLELATLAYRALRPGGIVVLATPDPRSLYAHLEMFYLHFGHVSFYHPRLLSFFLEHAGFVDSVSGSNATSVQPESPLFGLAMMHPIQVQLPIWKKTLFHRVLRLVRMAVAYVFLCPYLDLINSNFQRLSTTMRRIDYPFECFTKAEKPRATQEGVGHDG